MSELHGHHRNVWPEAVYCCFKELHCLPNCLHICMIRVVSITSPSFVALQLLVSELNVLPEAVYCCFTKTTLFTELFTTSPSFFALHPSGF